MLYVEVHSLFIYYFHSVIYVNCLAIWFFFTINIILSDGFILFLFVFSSAGWVMLPTY